MRRLLIALIVLLSAGPAFAQSVSSSTQTEIKWQTWAPDIFERAAKEEKLVILDLEAVWCHWCHVMEDVTYANDTVREVIHDNYIAVRADQAAHPGLSARYGDWGWPATIVFNAKGEELGKYRGFIPIRNMVGELVYYISNRTPQGEPLAKVEPAKSLYLGDKQRAAILNTYAETWDTEFAGWGRVLKFINPDTMQYALQQAREGDGEAKRKAMATLDAAMKLIDPVWGGIYQYSDAQDWSSPHFEKIMSYQRDVLKLYSEAYALFGETRYLQAAQTTRAYLKNFLSSPDGAFYASQNADVDLKLTGKDFYALDDAARRALGKMPGVDRNIYTRENGWAIQGLAALYNVAGDEAVLRDAVTAANWIIANRSVDGGGFAHGSQFEAEGPFLDDTLSMGEAFLDLHTATGDRQWLLKALDAARFMDATFTHQEAGFNGSKPAVKTGVFAEPVRNIEDNIRLGRFANLLAQVSGKAEPKAMAEHAMRYLASNSITSKRRFLLGILLLDRELSLAPAHVTIVGKKSDPRSADLHRLARALPLDYYRLDWLDSGEGPPINPDVQYPELAQPAAFACVNRICSSPITDRAELLATVEKFLSLRKPTLRAGK